MTSKRTYTTRDTKLLWGRSGGKCAYPNCRQSLVEIGPNVLLGEIAHIVAASPNGPRGDASYPQDRLNAYENLILLCPTHHRKIDDQNYIETADELRNWKNAHEAWVDQKLKEGEPWESNIQPYYYNIPKLGILAAQCQMMIDTDTLNQHRNLIDFGFELYKPLIQLHQLLKRIKPHAIPLLKIEDFSDDLVGSLISFEGGFRTKGIPGPHKSSTFQLQGDPEKDPQIYKKINDKRIVMNIDPRWIATSTGFSDLTSGNFRCAGLGYVKRWDPQLKSLFVSPLIFGIPKSQYSSS